MKNIKRILGGALMAVAAFGFFGCDDTEDDDELEVTIENTNDFVVSIVAPDEYDGKDVVIVYTTDGTDPEVKVKEDSSATDGYKVETNATQYDGPFQSENGTTIKARGYYVVKSDSGLDSYRGPVASHTVVKNESVTETNATEDVSGTSSGEFTFTLASSGNTNSIHYFDTANSNVFKLNDTHPKVYYQIQFSWRGTGKGNWYLYMRDVGGSIIKSSSGNSFISKGTYTGSVFDKSSTDCDSGDVVLKDSDGNDVGKITIDSNKKFTLKVTDDTSWTDASTTTVGTVTVDAK